MPVTMWKKHFVFCLLVLAVAMNCVVYGQNRKKGTRPASLARNIQGKAIFLEFAIGI